MSESRVMVWTGFAVDRYMYLPQAWNSQTLERRRDEENKKKTKTSFKGGLGYVTVFRVRRFSGRRRDH